MECLASLVMFVSMQETMIFYIPPHKLHTILAEMQDAFGGERRCCVAREVTKKFEQFLRGTIDSIIAELDYSNVRGEVTLLVEGSTDEDLITQNMPQVTIDRL